MASETLKRTLYTKDEIDAAVKDVARGIISEFPGGAIDSLAFLGIQKNGIPFNIRLLAAIKSLTGKTLESGTIDISMHRDDIGMRKALPVIRETNIPFDINERPIILVDDILHTGRTIRAALDVITDYGRPSLIRLAVLLDRMEREYPIRADYTGIVCASVQLGRKIKVEWAETDGEDVVREVRRSSSKR